MNFSGTIFPAALALCFSFLSAASHAVATPPPIASSSPPPVSAPEHPPVELRAIDADNRHVLLNRPGKITLVIGTNQDSQDLARAVGRDMYPFQGLRNFQLIVIADVRDSMATWVPSLVISRMRVSLDHEAFALKPHFLKNGNTDDPRKSTCAIADFTGTICPQLGWSEPSSHLRGILFGVDGRELERWDDLTDMPALQNEVRKAIHEASAQPKTNSSN